MHSSTQRGLHRMAMRIFVLCLVLVIQTSEAALLFGKTVTRRTSSVNTRTVSSSLRRQPRRGFGQFSAAANNYNQDDCNNNNPHEEMTVAQAITRRYACKAFLRFDGLDPDTAPGASPADPVVVQQAWQCLNLARLSPSSFNTQPYRVVLVHSEAQKKALSAACLGPNARRVLDADCTAVFLADKRVLRSILPAFINKNKSNDNGRRNGPPLNPITLFYIALFSSGYPLPRFLSAPLGFLVRTAMSVVDWFARLLLNFPLPSLSSTETWATKQTSLVAMSYMLACTSQGLATIPMEGIHAGLVRRTLGVPRRFAVPMIVATGKPATVKAKTGTLLSSSKDDAKENAASSLEKRRYPTQNVLFADRWMEHLSLAEAS